MSKLSVEISGIKVTEGNVRIWWLGQAGFAFKTSDGKIVYLDPYLSDAVERLHGFKRLSLSPILAEEVRADWVVLTHEHTDHLDPDALPVIAKNNPSCRFAAPAGCVDAFKKARIKTSRWTELKPNCVHPFDSMVVHTAPADHGDYSPTALALVLDFEGVRVLCSGDTSLRTKSFKPLYDLHVDVVLPCINGVFGNMNHVDASMMVQQAAPQIAIPCHYWTFAEQGAGDPGGFLNACRHVAPDAQAMVLKPGEGLTVTRGNDR